MNKNQKNNWKLISLILIIIVIILGIVIATDKLGEKTKKTKTNIVQSDNMELNEIRITERLLKNGNIEGIDHVTWTDATIREDNNQMIVDIRLTNESETKKVDSKMITAVLFNKEGKEIASQEVQMEELPENYSFTTLSLNFDITDISVIYDIKLFAK